MRSVIRHLAICLAFTACAGCETSMITSVDVTTAKPSEWSGGYITYAPARSLVQVTLSSPATTPKTQSATGGTAQQAATQQPAAAQDTASTSWTLSGTITQTQTPKTPTKANSNIQSGGGSNSTPDTGDCASLTSDYNAAQNTLQGLPEAYAALANDLKSLSMPSPTVDKAKVSAEAIKYISDYDNIKTEKTYFPVIYFACTPKLAVSVSQQAWPDPNHLFVVKAKDNALYNNNLTLKVDGNGLLSSGVGVASDQTQAILTSIATDVGEFVLPLPGTQIESPSISSRLPDQCKSGASPADLAKCLADAPSGKVAAYANALVAAVPKPATAPALPAIPSAADFPVTLTFTLDDLETLTQPDASKPQSCPQIGTTLDALSACLAEVVQLRSAALSPDPATHSPPPWADETTHLQTAYNDLQLARTLAVQLRNNVAGARANATAAARTSDKCVRARKNDCSSETSAADTAEAKYIQAQTDAASATEAVLLTRYGIVIDTNCTAWKEESAGDAKDGKPTAYDGLVVSQSRPCRIQARQLETGLPLADASFLALDSRHLRVLPLPRSALVTRTVEYDFTAGAPTGASDNRPSTLAAAVALPGAVLGGFISGITAAVTNKTTVTNDQTSLITAQTNLLNAQAALLKAQAQNSPSP